MDRTIHYFTGKYGRSFVSCSDRLYTFRRSRPCNEFPCRKSFLKNQKKTTLSILANWSAWSDGNNSCSVTCGGGSIERSRICLFRDEAIEDSKCVGKNKDVFDCNQQKCRKWFFNIIGISYIFFEIIEYTNF